MLWIANRTDEHVAAECAGNPLALRALRFCEHWAPWHMRQCNVWEYDMAMQSTLYPAPLLFNTNPNQHSVCKRSAERQFWETSVLLKLPSSHLDGTALEDTCITTAWLHVWMYAFEQHSPNPDVPFKLTDQVVICRCRVEWFWQMARWHDFVEDAEKWNIWYDCNLINNGFGPSFLLNRPAFFFLLSPQTKDCKSTQCTK